MSAEASLAELPPIVSARPYGRVVASTMPMCTLVFSSQKGGSAKEVGELWLYIQDRLARMEHEESRQLNTFDEQQLSDKNAVTSSPVVRQKNPRLGLANRTVLVNVLFRHLVL